MISLLSPSISFFFVLIISRLIFVVSSIKNQIQLTDVIFKEDIIMIKKHVKHFFYNFYF
jgi:hypothetical protein